MKLSLSFPLLWICIFALLMPVFVLQTEGQEIDIDLELAEENKAIYGINEPIKISISASSDNEIHVDQIFADRNLLRQIRIIDPTGRLVFPKRAEKIRPHHHTSMAYGFYDNPNDGNPGVYVRFAPCQPFSSIYKKANIRDFFDLELPGYYSAQVKTSAMIFKNGTCNVDAAPGLSKPWVGVLKSNTISFCVAGKKKVTVDPNVWHTSWKANSQNTKVYFTIKYENGRKKGYYKKNLYCICLNCKECIYLNDKKKLRAEFGNYKMKLTIKGSECIKSMGDDVVLDEHLVSITGWLKSGQSFGGGATISLEY